MQRNSLTFLRTGLFASLALGALSVASGCTETVDSDAIRTKGIYAKFEAVAGTKTTRVYSELRVGGDDGTYVHLVTGDQLTTTFGDSSENLSKDKDGYSHTFSGNAGGTSINVNFKRGEDKPAPDSNAELPLEFTPELAASVVARNKSVVVDLGEASPDSEIEWKVNGDCIFLASGHSADTGKLTLAASEIDATNSGKDDECSVTLTLDRVLKGTVDAAFGEGGEFRAIQRRTVAFTSVPADKAPAAQTNDAGAASASPSETGAAAPNSTSVNSSDNDAGATASDAG